VARLQQHQARANFPFLGANIVDANTGLNPDWVQVTYIIYAGFIPVGLIGIDAKTTPELVSAVWMLRRLQKAALCGVAHSAVQRLAKISCA
jgi:2',3'-cyclic-nucleotide 2'-phosphodiesterase (5'-nucleotidase family)